MEEFWSRWLEANRDAERPRDWRHHGRPLRRGRDLRLDVHPRRALHGDGSRGDPRRARSASRWPGSTAGTTTTSDRDRRVQRAWSSASGSSGAGIERRVDRQGVRDPRHRRLAGSGSTRRPHGPVEIAWQRDWFDLGSTAHTFLAMAGSGKAPQPLLDRMAVARPVAAGPLHARRPALDDLAPPVECGDDSSLSDPSRARLLIDGKLVDGERPASTYPILNPATGEEIGVAPDAHRRRRRRRDRRRAARLRRDRLVDRPRAAGALPAPAAPGAGRPRRGDARADHGRGRGAGVPHRRPAVRRAGRGPALDGRPGRGLRVGDRPGRRRADGHPDAPHDPARAGRAWSPRSRRGTSRTRSTSPRSARRWPAGSTVVLKPAPDTPWVAAELGRLAAEHTDLPPGVLNVVTPRDNGVGAVLATDPRVDLVVVHRLDGDRPRDHGRRRADAEEGVPRARRQVGRDRARRRRPRRRGRHGRVHACASTPARAARSPRGCSSRASGTTRRSRSPPRRWPSIGAKDPTDPGTICGPVISRPSATGSRRYLAPRRARRAARSPPAARVDRPATGFWIEPTVIAGLDNDAARRPGGDLRPGARRASPTTATTTRCASPTTRPTACPARSTPATPSGPGPSRPGSAPARSPSTAASGSAPDAPFGGYKQSGIGREMGVAGFEEYLETKTIAEGA